MKGVSEVIAIILILMITISLAGLAYMFMSTTMGDVTASAGSTVDTTTSSMLTSFTIESIDVAKVYVRNTGQNALTSLSVYVNDEPAIFNVTTPIVAGAMGTVTIYSFIPDGAIIKVTSASGFSTSKVANPCSKSVSCWKFDEADMEVNPTIKVANAAGWSTHSNVQVSDVELNGVSWQKLDWLGDSANLGFGISTQNWTTQGDYVTFYYKGSGTGSQIRLYVGTNDYLNLFRYTFTDNFTDERFFKIPFGSFVTAIGTPSWSAITRVKFDTSTNNLVGNSHYIRRFGVDIGVPAIDFSGKGNTAIPINGASLTTGKFGNGLLFDGVNDYVNLPSSQSLNITPGNPLTITSWVKPNQNGQQAIISGNQLNFGSYLLYLRNAPGFDIGFTVQYNSTHRFGGTAGTVPNGMWSYIVGMFNGTNLVVFVNGVSYDVPASFVAQAPSFSPRLGYNGGVSSPQYFNGMIDEVRIYDRAIY